MGPSPKPSKPVKANTTPIPAAELAVRGRTNHTNNNAATEQAKLVPWPTVSIVDTIAIRALKISVADKSAYVLRRTLFADNALARGALDA